MRQQRFDALPHTALKHERCLQREEQHRARKQDAPRSVPHNICRRAHLFRGRFDDDAENWKQGKRMRVND